MQGRGAIDNKHNLLMQLAAVERTLAGGILRPKRTLLLSYGMDEEIGGRGGAREINKVLLKRFNRPCSSSSAAFSTTSASSFPPPLEFIMDEGAMILRGAVPGLKDRPVAMVCNAEKGAINVRLTVNTVCPPGHSSSPPPESNVGVLAKAIASLERPSNLFPAHPGNFFEMLRFVGAQLPIGLRIAVANTWLFGPIIRSIALAKPKTAPLIRTTTAATVVKAGAKVNVVPGEATALVNHRIHPRDVDGGAGYEPIIAYDERVIGDKRVSLEPFSFGGVPDSWIPPSPVSGLDTFGFRNIMATVSEIFGAPTVPMLMTGNTDTRWYWKLSDAIYRFSPIVLDLEDVGMFHGVDERCSTSNLVALCSFYERLVERSCL